MAEKTVLDSEQMASVLKRMARQIVADVPTGSALALVGIRSRGETIAKRLHAMLREEHSLEAQMGTLDITLYRDDLGQMGYKQPVVKTTEIDFDIDDTLIVLVDDVVNTGRSTRAALDALIDLGRPKAIRLAVLIDRGHRELPISPDYVGEHVETSPDERVFVYLRETDQREEVITRGAE